MFRPKSSDSLCPSSVLLRCVDSCPYSGFTVIRSIYVDCSVYSDALVLRESNNWSYAT